MATYDYRCRECEARFSVQRAMTETAARVQCPRGHDDVARVWSAVSVTGRAAAAPSVGGCCGGGCCAQ